MPKQYQYAFIAIIESIQDNDMTIVGITEKDINMFKELLKGGIDGTETDRQRA